MCRQISNSEFEEIMEKLYGNTVGVQIITRPIWLTIFYPEFEFFHFLNGTYQFGHKEWNSENEYQNLIIKTDGIEEIYRDTFSPTFGSEQLILDLADDVRLVVNCDQLGGIVND